MNARYLLRLDDACPTLDGDKWRRIEALFDELTLKPIVAITPDNLDPDLHFSAPDAAFWDRARGWQAKGWAIGLHGFRHILPPYHGKQYLPLHPRSEFAGLSVEEQASKIRQGWAVLQSRGLTATVWVAPAHSFDRTTLEALARETSIRIVSDGLARDQYFADGFNWIPQQLWSLAPKRDGLWTVCLHPNTMSEADFHRLEEQLRGDFSGAIVDLADVQLTQRMRSLGDRIEAADFWRRHYFQRGVGIVKKLAGR